MRPEERMYEDFLKDFVYDFKDEWLETKWLGKYNHQVLLKNDLTFELQLVYEQGVRNLLTDMSPTIIYSVHVKRISA